MRLSFAFLLFLLISPLYGADQPFCTSELIFPLEHWHNHSSSIVEMPDGGFFVCWFHGAGERKADDVQVLASRLLPGKRSWTKPFPLVDTPGFPDTNPTLFIDRKQRLWVFWPVILANQWHTALMKYKVSSKYQQGDGTPVWEVGDNLLLTPDLGVLERKVREVAEPALKQSEPNSRRALFLKRLIRNSTDKLFSRLGWMTRTHPVRLPSGRIIVPLYSDGYSFSIMALSDDGGRTWKASEPLVGFGSIQPSVVRRRDGTLVAYMRDNGPPPKRIHLSTSSDDGMTWSRVIDTDMPNPGSSCEAIVLNDGTWMLVYNDTERGRYSLAVSLSDDEGKTWKWTRHLERDLRGKGAGSFHYPSVIQARDGSLHVTYSYFVRKEGAGNKEVKSIKHARFNVAWVKQGDSK